MTKDRILASLQWHYTHRFGDGLPPLHYDGGANDASIWLHRGIRKAEPFMVGRFGSIELSVVCNYLGVNFTPPLDKKRIFIHPKQASCMVVAKGGCLNVSKPTQAFSAMTQTM